MNAAESRRATLLAGGILAAAALAAYSNSFHAPLVFDDAGTIAQNASIRHFWSALHPPEEGMPVTGRPIANLSLAVNYAISGTRVWSYHAVNLLIHILAGWTLFGLIRRMPIGRDTSLIAFSAALIWTLHPLQTESVTYISQRAESLMGLFYLLTLYSFIRSVECLEVERPVRRPLASPPGLRSESGPGTGRSTFFACLSVAACLLGMATKEVMATAPVIVFLYDRTFLAGSFAQAWRRRRGCYLALAATWIVLIVLLAGTGSRGGTAGFAADISPPAYAYTQLRAIAHYLRLSFWPSPLVFFYGSAVGGPGAEMAVDAVVVVALLAAVVWALLRPVNRGYGGRALGFAGAWFFLILAPSSSIVPVATETIAEHRMYLPLAAVVVAVTAGIFSLISAAGRWPGRRAAALALLVCVVIATGFGAMTFQRNEDYRSELTLWRATAESFPGNEVAQYNLGLMLARKGEMPEAIARYREALRLKPGYTEARSNLGEALAATGRWTEAIAEYREAVARDPEYGMVYANLGDALLRTGQLGEAGASYDDALQTEPDNPDLRGRVAAADNDLGVALMRAGRIPEAIARLRQALQLRPGLAEAHDNLGAAFARSGRMDEAAGELQQAARLVPQDPQIRDELGSVLAQLGRAEEARAAFGEALRLAPGDETARAGLARLPRE